MTRTQRRALRALLAALQEATERWALLADAAKAHLQQAKAAKARILRQAEAQLRRRRA